MLRPWSLLVVSLILAACGPSEAQRIVDEAIAAHGGQVLDHAVVEFDFRGQHFVVRRDGGRFHYDRTYTDSTGASVREVLSSDSLYRAVSGDRVDLSQEERRAVETAVNSVVYFAFLPYRLNDPAVQKRLLGTDTLRGATYDVVEVTFEQQGGGRDWQDRFVYWFHQSRHTMDYLAYHYHTDGGGSRFREATNPRTVDGLRVADYLNYTAPGDTMGPGVERYADLLEQGALEKVSEVRLENVRVQPLD